MTRVSNPIIPPSEVLGEGLEYVAPVAVRRGQGRPKALVEAHLSFVCLVLLDCKKNKKENLILFYNICLCLRCQSCDSMPLVSYRNFNSLKIYGDVLAVALRCFHSLRRTTCGFRAETSARMRLYAAQTSPGSFRAALLV